MLLDCVRADARVRAYRPQQKSKSTCVSTPYRSFPAGLFESVSMNQSTSGNARDRGT